MVSRFTFTAANIAASELLLYSDPDGLQGQIWHFGGDITFGPGAYTHNNSHNNNNLIILYSNNMIFCPHCCRAWS